MAETQSVSTIIQGGAVGIALAALYVIYRMQNGQRQSFIEALDRNSVAFTSFAVAIQSLSDSVKVNTADQRRRHRN